MTFGSILLWSCDSTTEKMSGAGQEVTATDKPHLDNNDATIVDDILQRMNNEGHQQDKAIETVELNNGERWLVNDEMKPFVEKGERLVNAYVQEGKSDYKELAAQIKGQNDQLVKSCTMDSKSDEELHKWLHPHLDLVKDLAQETDNVKAAETISNLQKSYRQYHQYFK